MPRIKKSSRATRYITTEDGVRERRIFLGMAQDDLAKKLGLTFQQMQKYENGTTRIAVSRLLEITEAPKVSPLFPQGTL